MPPPELRPIEATSNTCFDTQTYKDFIDNDVKLANSQGFLIHLLLL
jgi:hypothetical protein